MTSTTAVAMPTIHQVPDNSDHPNPLIGELLSYDKGSSGYGDFVVMLVEDDQGVVWSRAIFGSVMENLLDRKRPIPGNRVSWTYLGQKVSEGAHAGKTYANWDLQVQRPPQTLNFDAFAAGEVILQDTMTDTAPVAIEASVDDLGTDRRGLPEPTLVEPTQVDDDPVPF